MKISEIVRSLEEWAPLGLQLEYDNSGLQIGDAEAEVESALLTLDVTDEVVSEAIDNGHKLIVAHHPLIFAGLKKVIGRNYVEKIVARLIKNDIALMAVHTNLDSILTGVNYIICQKLGIEKPEILSPNDNKLFVLSIYCPEEWRDRLLNALWEAGAGNIGAYADCANTIETIGHFTPIAGANPHVGEVGRRETVKEARIDVLYSQGQLPKLLAAARKLNFYEEVAYHAIALQNKDNSSGFGMIGDLKEEMSSIDFLTMLKLNMQAEVVRYTRLDDKQKKIKKVAVCGGAGSDLLKTAMALGADAYVSADFKYHQFFDAEGQIMIADIGHFESEQFTPHIIHEYLSKRFSKFALSISQVKSNPISYF